MKRLTNPYIKACVKACFIFGFAALSIISSANTASTDNSRKLKTLQGEITQAQSKLQLADNETNRLHKQLKTSELKLATNHRKHRLLQSHIADLEKELDTLNKHRDQLKINSKAQLHQLHNEIAIAYRLGQQEPLKLLLNIEDPQEFNRTLKYYDYFVSARTGELNKYRNTLTEIDALGNTIKARRSTLIDQRSVLDKEREKLKINHKQRELLLVQVKQLYNSESARLKQLKTEESHLQSIIETIHLKAPQAAAGSPFSKQNGLLPWPVKGTLISAFGDQRAKALRWSGWLLRSDEGSTVRAIHPGVVIFSNYLRGYGLLIIVDHGDGYMSLYAHNQTLTRDVGETVKRGTTIARVGNSGGLKHSALYFEIRHKGKAINPKLWLGRPS